MVQIGHIPVKRTERKAPLSRALLTLGGLFRRTGSSGGNMMTRQVSATPAAVKIGRLP